MNEFLKIIKKRRKEIVAPVDSMGCTCVPETTNKDIQKFQILLMLVLSSQTKDETTFKAMQNLQKANLLRIFDIYNAKEDDVNGCIKQVGFHNKKSRYIKGICSFIYEGYLQEIMRKRELPNGSEMLLNLNICKNIDSSNCDGVSLFKNNLPEKRKECKVVNISDSLRNSLDCEINKYNRIDILLKLPGVGKKVAFLFLESAFDDLKGIGVDTHVHRIINRIGFKTKNAEETRKFLEKSIPKFEWKGLNKALVGYGQVICTPINPSCNNCPLINCKSRVSF
ncbi:Endonuclease III like protein [Dictyocoela roeselum]|nr:Endonuclease III like protein [Dictyocoela roeselum]